jgi:NAD(P)-dependent dehydrogenase (short-subunit alcohol dehydrogenase family)
MAAQQGPKLLEGKTAVIYGGGGSIGRAMAAAFAREGAHVFLTGRTQAPLDDAAEALRADGGEVDTAVVDALDEGAVDAQAAEVVARTGRLDVSINVIGVNDVQGTPLAEMTVDDFLSPIATATRTQFLTTRAAARQMITQGSGVILFFGGSGDPVRDYSIGGFQIALQAIEALRRQLASELGKFGIRAVSLRTGGIGEAIPADFPERDEIMTLIADPTLLGRTATLADVGNVAAFVASDQAASITGAAINISCGAMFD